MSARHSQFALRSRRVVTPEGVRPATVVIDQGTIRDILAVDEGSDFSSLENFGDLVISPGVIDAHVHVNEPGRTDWEGFATATRAAAAGGVTTIVDMPLNSSPVTTTPAALAEKRAAAIGKCWVDVGFYGGLVPGNADQIARLCEQGVLGVKAFLCHSGLDEFPNATEQDLREAMPILARAGVPLLVHAELVDAVAPEMSNTRSYAEYVASRPPRWELTAIEMLLRLCREFHCPVHIVHLATSEALPRIAAAKREGLPITVETCPHYLLLDASTIADGDTRFKCAPPIRPGENDMLWQGLIDGTIDTIGSDHSPCPSAMKCVDTGNFQQAWGGIASLQLTLSSVWTACSEHGNGSLSRMAQWLSRSPAKIFGLSDRKGQIAAGYDADLVVWNPERQWRVQGDKLFHRHSLTPYDGMTLAGKVIRTYVRGTAVFAEEGHLGSAVGELLQRESSL